jgi:SH3/ankyrin repeat-containing protein
MQTNNKNNHQPSANSPPLPPPPPQLNGLNSDNSSSSPASRSRSISSDDHGFGSASLSQMSGSTNVDFVNSTSRKRLYSSIPNRTYLCVKPFKAAQSGELELRKGDLVEVFSIGDSGYWEGRCLSNACEGWFKANCVEEFMLPEHDSDEIVMKRKTLFDLITLSDLSALRTVVLQRGKKGFGFVLRGAKSKFKQHIFNQICKQ